jgi:hypothetical protein
MTILDYYLLRFYFLGSVSDNLLTFSRASRVFALPSTTLDLLHFVLFERDNMSYNIT